MARTIDLRVPSSAIGVESASEYEYRLSAIDSTMPAYLTIMLQYFYELPAGWNSATEEFMPADEMSASLQRLLASYPFLGGRLERDESHHASWIVRGTDRPIPFVVATTDARIADLPLSAAEFTSTDVLPPSLQLLPGFDYTRPLDEALLQVQHTRFACGGVSLGVRVHHAAMDGAAFFTFIANWSEMYRNQSQQAPNTRPNMDRSQLLASDEEMARLLETHTESTYYTPTPAQQEQRMAMMMRSAGVACKNRIFRFESVELAGIKQAASASEDQQDGQSQWVSTFEALVAHLYRRICAARLTESDGAAAAASDSAASSSSSDADATSQPPPRLSVAINIRPRMQSPSLDANYTGNATLSALVAPEDPSSRPLSATAAHLHSSLASYDSDRLRGMIAWLAAQPRQDEIVYALDNTRDLIVTQWSKFPMYSGAEFEIDSPPIRICMPHFPGMNGVIVLYSTPDEAESIDLLCGLDADTMAKLEADPLFRAFRQKGNE